MKEFILIIFAYILGSIPFGIILARHYGGKDITKEGSGNTGATNVARVVGNKAGIMTLALDALKGIIPLIAAMIAVGDVPWFIALVALAAFSGHLWPLFNNFKGGKGVATALGVFIALSPFSALCALAIFGAIVYIRRYVSLGSIIAAGSMPALMGLFNAPKAYILLALIMSALVIYRHKDNIRRLLDGSENRLGEKTAEDGLD